MVLSDVEGNVVIDTCSLGYLVILPSFFVLWGLKNNLCSEDGAC